MSILEQLDLKIKKKEKLITIHILMDMVTVEVKIIMISTIIISLPSKTSILNTRPTMPTTDMTDIYRTNLRMLILIP